MSERCMWTAVPERDKFLHPCAAFTMGSHKLRMRSGSKTISQAQVMQRKISSGRNSWAWLLGDTQAPGWKVQADFAALEMNQLLGEFTWDLSKFSITWIQVFS